MADFSIISDVSNEVLKLLRGEYLSGADPVTGIHCAGSTHGQKWRFSARAVSV